MRKTLSLAPVFAMALLAVGSFTLSGVALAADAKGNYAEAAKNLEAGLNSGFLAQEDIPTRVRALSQIAYQTKNYAKAIEYGNRAI